MGNSEGASQVTMALIIPNTVIYMLICLHGRRLSRRRRHRRCYRRRQRTISRNILNLITAFNKNRLPRELGVALGPYGLQIMKYRMLRRHLLQCHFSRQGNRRHRVRDIVEKPD